MFNGWSGFCSPFFDLQTKFWEVLLKTGSVDVLGKDVRWIVGPQYFGESKVAAFESVLDPKIRHRKVPNLSETFPSTHSYGRRSIGVEMDVPLKAEVFGQ